MITDSMRLGHSEKRQVEITKREKQPSADKVRRAPPDAPGKKQLHVFDHEHQQCRGGACPPPLGDNLKRSRQFLQTIQREPPVILRVFMKRVTERRYQMNVTAGGKHPPDLAHYAYRITNVFEHRIAFHALKDVRREGQVLGIRRNVNPGHSKQIEVHAAVDCPAGAADIEIPAAQGKIGGFGRIHNERRRWLDEPNDAVAPTR